MLKKVLIANRGEIAVRVMRACEELGVRTVAVYSEADRWSPFVARADEALAIGPAPSSESYLRIDRILEAAGRTASEAVHPGYGFLAENAELARACQKAGLTFIGPPPEAIDRIGNKKNARQLAESIGVPVVQGCVLSDEETAEGLRAAAGKLGYPLLIKAAAGGGGKGMRLLQEPGQAERALREARSEARSAFGDASLYLESYLERPRHIEIQVMADTHGNVVQLGERECSIQRRHQKLVEESPSPAVDEPLRAKMGEAAVALVRAAGYVNAGTVEFLLDSGGQFYFLELNARLQVEHPVTEAVTRLDLVKLQLQVAAGEKLPLRQEEVRLDGAAIECRICAEDPFQGFMPSTGTLASYTLPQGPFTRVEECLMHGMEISLHYDPMIAKLITWGKDRPEALARMRRALQETCLMGVRTTVPFHLWLLDHPDFRAGRLHTHFVQEHFKAQAAGREEEWAAMAAAVLEYERARKRAPQTQPAPPNGWGLMGRRQAVSRWPFSTR